MKEKERGLFLVLAAIPIGLGMAFVAQGLMLLINFITQLAFYGRIGFGQAAPAGNHLGLWVLAVPVAGGLLIGLMARYGAKAIRGHGIPEAMERVLQNDSVIPARITWLKPLSAAISIGTGGPFGAEGPIIATGGAAGSLLGQILSTTAAERKVMLASGAAAGMAATFGSPLSAVLLAIELLLFEYKPRSFIPVALASTMAAAMRAWLTGAEPIFQMPHIEPASAPLLLVFMLLGALAGVAATGITKAVYFIEDAFERLPIHWMWWPALGGLAVGVVGYFEPLTMGVGYTNIDAILNGSWTATAVIALCTLKFVSWSLALGSGTSGGTLAPLLTMGSGLGFAIGMVLQHYFPALGIDPHLAALVGMASLFAGASQAVLASAVFAFETTGQAGALPALLAGCAMAYFVARLLARNSIMTEKIVRRGVAVPYQYGSDVFEHTAVSQVMERDIRTISADMEVRELMARVAAHDPEVCHHQALLITHENGRLAGIITRGDLIRVAETEKAEGNVLEGGTTNLVVAHPEETLHAAIEKMLRHDVGRLPVVERGDATRLVGYLSRSAILSARWKLMQDESRVEAGWLAEGFKSPAKR